MKRITYIAGAVVFALAGLGIYASNAQNMNNNDSDTLVFEEESYMPAAPNRTNPVSKNRMNNSAANNNSENIRNPQNNQLTTGNNTANMNSRQNQNNPTINNNNPANADFEPLPNNPGVEVAPDNQPVASKAMKNQNPNYNNGNPNNGMIIEEDYIETVD